MNLRPHHLLCIRKFTGHGYNEAFTAHMKSVVSELTEDPGTEITITQGCDELCKRCPNNQGGVCDSPEKVDFLDRAVLGACGLSYGEKILWETAADKARKEIFETERFHNICACCQWYELCRSTEVKS